MNNKLHKLATISQNYQNINFFLYINTELRSYIDGLKLSGLGGRLLFLHMIIICVILI